MRPKLPLRTNEDQGERLGWSRGLALRLGRVLARSWVGGLALAFYLALFLVDPPAIMHAIDHPAYSPFPLLTFLPLVALKSYYDHGRRLAFGAAVAAVFAASVYLVYPQLLMALVSWIALSLLGIVRVDRRHLLVFSGAVAFGVLLHFFQNLLFLGPSIFLKELQFTLANRMFALPISDELRAMYQDRKST